MKQQFFGFGVKKMEYNNEKEFEKIKEFVKQNEKVKQFWFDKKNCEDLVQKGKVFAKENEFPKIAYCFMTTNRIDEMTKAINRVRSYVDKIIAVDGGSVDNTIEYLQNIPKCNIIKRKWDDKFDVQRNQYLNHVLEKYSDYWILVSDTDEWFSDDLMKNLGYIILAVEKLGINRLGFLSMFRMVKTTDSAKEYIKLPAFKSEEQGGMKRTFFKKLCFKPQKEMKYVKSPHEGLLGNWVIGNLGNLEWYFEHVKTRKSEVERGCRNYFIAGPGMKKDERWEDFKELVKLNSWELWNDMNSAMIEKKLPNNVLKWIWSRKDWQLDGPPSSEQREFWIYYYEFLHPQLLKSHKKIFECHVLNEKEQEELFK